MTQTARITYFGMEGEGRNLTEAKRDAGRKVEQALEGSYTPELIGDISKGYAMLLVRQPKLGWESILLYPGKEGALYGSSGSDTTKEECERRARAHLAGLLNDVSYIDGKRYPADVREWESG